MARVHVTQVIPGQPIGRTCGGLKGSELGGYDVGIEPGIISCNRTGLSVLFKPKRAKMSYTQKRSVVTAVLTGA